MSMDSENFERLHEQGCQQYQEKELDAAAKQLIVIVGDKKYRLVEMDKPGKVLKPMLFQITLVGLLK